MSGDIQTALAILLTGMAVVFLMLGLVVITGRVLIATVNRWNKDKAPTPGSGAGLHSKTSSIPTQKIAAITAAVDIATGGKAAVENIQRLEHSKQNKS
ncbi:MAG: OadG family protein [Saprospiraceae bacterium]|nr:OadG family protein [Saprospiraceae bacterium]